MDSYLKLLMDEYQQADVPLDQVAEKYLNMSSEKVREKARRGELPFPVYRPGSQKSTWLVRITDLADWLTFERQKAMTNQVGA